MVYKRAKGWTLGQSLPVLNFDKYTPLPPRGGGGQNANY